MTPDAAQHWERLNAPHEGPEPQRCACGAAADASCAACGDPICDDHARDCESDGCLNEKQYCSRCVTAVDDFLLCHAHLAAWPLSDEREAA